MCLAIIWQGMRADPVRVRFEAGKAKFAEALLATERKPAVRGL